MIRQTDSTGRLVIPMEMRRAIGVGNNCDVFIELKGDVIIIKKATDTIKACSNCKFKESKKCFEFRGMVMEDFQCANYEKEETRND